MCREVWVPLNKEKTQVPTTCLVCHGLTIDTLKMQIKIPLHNVSERFQLVSFWVIKEKIIFKDLENLVEN